MPSAAARPESAVATEPQATDPYPEYRRGVVLGIVAYGMWGLFPLYWPLLRPAGTLEILAHRMVWSLVFLLGVLWWVGRRKGTGLATLRALLADRPRLLLLAGAAAIVTVNWGIYIYGVNTGHVVETALGYFIGPLVSVLIGVLLLKERLRGTQWIAVGLGGASVVVLTIGYGRLPWIALSLAVSFAIYGLIKKVAATGAIESLAVETGLMLLPALLFIGSLEITGPGTFVDLGIGHALLLAGAGVATALPLLAFGGAAVRIPLSMLGLLQYIAPVIQFAIGVLVYREAMPVERWIGFTLVWLALAVLSWDGIRRASSLRRPATAPAGQLTTVSE
jgi:chloramphenicol-sensitive protein RarD